MVNKVVAALLDGKRVKGTTANFNADRDRFHLTTPEGEMVELHLDKLKAVFFVNALDGSPTYHETKGFESAKGFGRKMRCEFLDGEVLTGFAVGYNPARLGFYLTPSDPKSNNQRIFVINSSVKRVAVLP
jgi:hypothetical protein